MTVGSKCRFCGQDRAFDLVLHERACQWQTPKTDRESLRQKVELLVAYTGDTGPRIGDVALGVGGIAFGQASDVSLYRVATKEALIRGVALDTLIPEQLIQGTQAITNSKISKGAAGVAGDP